MGAITNKVFYCLDCKQTFVASPEELKRACEEYEKEREAIRNGKCLFFPVILVINGHARWIYREDENYESIDS